MRLGLRNVSNEHLAEQRFKRIFGALEARLRDLRRLPHEVRALPMPLAFRNLTYPYSSLHARYAELPDTLTPITLLVHKTVSAMFRPHFQRAYSLISFSSQKKWLLK